MSAMPCAVLVGLVLSCGPVQVMAQSLLWDTDPATPGEQGGSGNWTGTNFWLNLATNQQWADLSSATFGGLASGTVTINSAIAVNGLAFMTSGYRLTGPFPLTLVNPAIDVANPVLDSFAEINTAIGGTVGLIKNREGILILSGTQANSYTGTTTIRDGALYLQKTGVNAIPGDLVIGDSLGGSGSVGVSQFSSNQIADPAKVTVNSDGVWSLSNNSETIGALELNGGRVQIENAGALIPSSVRSIANAATALVVGRINLGGAVRVFDVANGSAATDLSLGPVQVGTDGLTNGGITKIGSGTLELSGANTFTTLQINAGTVSVADVANAGVASPLGAGTSIGLDGGKLAVIAATNKTLSRPITLGPSGGAFESMSFLTLSGVISGTGGLTKSNFGPLILTGTNTFTGPVNVTAGGLTVPTVTDSGVPGPIGAGTTVNLNNGALEVTGSGTHSTNRNFVLGPQTAQIHATSGTVNVTGVVSGTAGIAITGNGGTVVFSGINTFAGDVFISNGPITLRTANGRAIPDSSGVNVSQGAVFDLNGTTETIGSLTDPTPTSPGGSVTLGAGTLLVGQNGRNTTFSGVISGPGGSLTKEGFGTLTLKGANTFTGPISIFGGVIQVADVSNSGIPGPLGAGSVFNFGQMSTLEFTAGVNDSMNRQITLGMDGGRVRNTGSSGVLTLAGVISGPGSFLSSGFLELTATNTFAGGVNIEGGILSVPSVANSGVASPIGAGSAIAISNGAGFFLQGFGTSSTNRSVFVSGGVSLSPGNGLVTFSGPITGTGGINLTGPGVLELSGTNTFSGGVSVFNSTLRIANGSAIPDAADVFLSTGGTLSGFQVNNSSETIGSLEGGSATSGAVSLGTGTLTIGANDRSTSFGGVISGTGSIVKTGSGALTLTRASTFSGSMNIQKGSVVVADVADAGVPSPIGGGGNILLGATGSQGTLVYTGTSDDSMVRTITLNGGGGFVTVSNPTTTLTLAGGINGSGTFGVTGPGVVLLNGSTNYTGPTVIGPGVLRQIGGSRFSNASAFILSNAAGSVLDLNNINAGIGSLAGGGSSGGTVLLGNAPINVGFDGTSTTFSGTISGTGQLVKVGTGTLTLDGTNTYSGITGVSAGTLRLSGGNAIADTSPLVVGANGTAEFVNGTETIASLLDSGSVKLSGGNLNVGANNAGTFFVGVISGTGNLTKVGTGTLTLTVSPTYTGSTNVSSGKLVLDGGFDTAGAPITVAASANLDARGAVSRSIAGSGTITATGTLTIGNSTSTSGFDFNGALAIGSQQVILADADFADLGTATSLGAGAQLTSLNGIRIAAGRGITTTPSVSASIGGNLVNNGVIIGPTQAGQTLSLTGDVSGIGSYAGNVRFTDSFSPGNSAAAVSLENFTLAPSHTLTLEIGGLTAGSQYDRLNFSGSTTLGGNLTVAFIGGFAPAEGNSFLLINGGALSGSFSSFTLPPLNPALAWQYSQTASSATLIVIPEPSSLGLLFVACALAISGRRSATTRYGAPEPHFARVD